jgi:two-component system, NarL family, nitrate/nitrite response regulator NarL
VARSNAQDPLETVIIGANALMREGLARILSEASFRVIVSAHHIDEAVLRAVPRDKSVLLVVDAGRDFHVAQRQVESVRQQFPSARVAVLAHHHQLSEMLTALQAGANAYFARDPTGGSFINILKLMTAGETIVLADTSSLFDDGQNGLDNDNSGQQQSSTNNGCYPVNRSHQYSHDQTLDEADLDDVENGDPNHESIEDGNDASSFSEAQEAVLCLSARQLAILRCLSEGDSNKVIARKISISEGTVKVHVKAILRKIQVHNRTQAAIWALNHGGPITACEKNGSSRAPKLSSPAARAPASRAGLVARDERILLSRG